MKLRDITYWSIMFIVAGLSGLTNYYYGDWFFMWSNLSGVSIVALIVLIGLFSFWVNGRSES